MSGIHSNSLQIYTCHHNWQQPYFHNEFITPIFSDPTRSSIPSEVLSSATGLNINSLRYSACEMTNHYWVSKNIGDLPCYIGFQHYRRVFFYDYFLTPYRDIELIKQLRLYFEIKRRVEIQVPIKGFTELTNHYQNYDGRTRDEIFDAIKDVDVVLPRKVEIPTGMKRQFGEGFPERQKEFNYIFDRFKSLVIKHAFFKNSNLDWNEIIDMLDYCYFFNMYIMRRRWYLEYMNCWSEIILELEELKKFTTTQEEGRFLGGLSERLLTCFIVRLRLTVPNFAFVEVPVVTQNTRII